MRWAWNPPLLVSSSARSDGLLTYLEPGETREYNLEIEFTDDPAVIDTYRAQAKNP